MLEQDILKILQYNVYNEKVGILILLLINKRI